MGLSASIYSSYFFLFLMFPNKANLEKTCFSFQTFFLNVQKEIINSESFHRILFYSYLYLTILIKLLISQNKMTQ